MIIVADVLPSVLGISCNKDAMGAALVLVGASGGLWVVGSAGGMGGGGYQVQGRGVKIYKEQVII